MIVLLLVCILTCLICWPLIELLVSAAMTVLFVAVGCGVLAVLTLICLALLR